MNKEQPFCHVCKSTDVTWKSGLDENGYSIWIGQCFTQLCVEEWGGEFEFYWGSDGLTHWI